MQLSEKKFKAILIDIFLMESYITEKLPTTSSDSITIIKIDFCKKILEHHKTDSADFYNTFYYYQTHPTNFLALLNDIDTTINKIKPKDTTSIVVKSEIVIPKGIEKMAGFNVQETALADEFIKIHPEFAKNKRRNINKKKE